MIQDSKGHLRLGNISFYDNSLSERKKNPTFLCTSRLLGETTNTANAQKEKHSSRNITEKLQVYLGSYILSSERGCANEHLLLQQAGWLSEAAAAMAADMGSLIAVGGPNVLCCWGLQCHITVMNLCKLIAAF